MSEKLTVYFRTSEEVVDSGFMMAVLCLDGTDLNGIMDLLYNYALLRK